MIKAPQIIKYIDQEMPIIISTCCFCNIELFRSITYEPISMHKNYCIDCANGLETEAWQYRKLCK